MRFLFSIVLVLTVPGLFSGMTTIVPETTEVHAEADTSLTTEFVRNPFHEPYDYISVLADALDVPEADLFSLIYFETGGSLNPNIRNPNSSAGGLLQFIDASSRTLVHSDGKKYTSTQDLLNKCPTVACQLAIPSKDWVTGGPCYQYLKRFNISSKEDLFMAVFYPNAVGKGSGYILPKDIQDLNTGIHSVSEYVRRVEQQISSIRKF